MSQHRRAEVQVQCDVPGCLATWHYVDEREHASGRPSDWLHVFLSPPYCVPANWRSHLDFCPAHVGGTECVNVIAATLAALPKSHG